MSQSPITKEQWAALEQELSSVFGTAELAIDGHAVALQVQKDKMRLVISVFVGGWMKGEWLVKKTEEATRFCRPVKVSLFTPARKKSIAKGFSKSAIKKYFPEFDKKGVYYSSAWLSFGAMKRHLIKNNTLISVVRIGLPSPVTEGAAA